MLSYNFKAIIMYNKEKWTQTLNIYLDSSSSSIIVRSSVHHKPENKEPSQIESYKLGKFKKNIYSKFDLKCVCIWVCMLMDVSHEKPNHHSGTSGQNASFFEKEKKYLYSF